MDKCFGCSELVSTTFYMDGNWVCKHCYIAPPSRVTAGLQVDLGDGKNKKITAAHIDDIQHRMIGPNMEVYRETNRKSCRT